MIKKLLLFLVICIGAITNAQTTIEITTINGDDPETFKTNNPSLAAGTVLNVLVTYNDVKDNGGGSNLHIKLFDDWAFYPGKQTDATVTNSLSDQTITLQLTIPSVNPGTSLGRLQVRGYNGSSWDIGPYVTGLVIATDVVPVSAAVSITTINAMTTSAYHTLVAGELTEGAVLTIGVDYTAIKSSPSWGDATQVRVRFLDSEYAEIPEATTAELDVSNSDSAQSGSVDLTVPNIGADLNSVRIQVLGYGYSGGVDATVNSYVSETFNIDSTVLSVSKVKNVLDNVYYSQGIDAIKINSDISGEYSIYNMTGVAVQSGLISSEISVESLQTGIYVFVTQNGSIKFVK